MGVCLKGGREPSVQPPAACGPRVRGRPTQPPHKGRAALPWDHSHELQYSVSVPERNTRGKLDKLLKKRKYQVAFYQRLLFYPGAVGEGSSENSSRSRPKTFQTSIQNYFELPRRVRGKKFWVPSTASYPANAASALSPNEGLFGFKGQFVGACHTCRGKTYHILPSVGFQKAAASLREGNTMFSPPIPYLPTR